MLRTLCIAYVTRGSHFNSAWFPIERKKPDETDVMGATDFAAASLVAYHVSHWLLFIHRL